MPGPCALITASYKRTEHTRTRVVKKNKSDKEIHGECTTPARAGPGIQDSIDNLYSDQQNKCQETTLRLEN